MKILSFVLDHLVWLILAAVLAAFCVSIENFFQVQIFINILRQSTFVGILSLGLCLAILAGHMDLSIESVMAFSATAASYLVATGGAGRDWPVSIAFTLLVSLVCGLLVGLFNGILVVYLRINAFIVTLSAYIGVRGLGLVLTQGESIYGLPEAFRKVATVDAKGIPLLVLILVFLYAVFHVLLTRTKLGRYIYLIGGNESAPFRAGIPVRGILLLVFALSGVLAAFAGWLLAARTGGSTANLGIGMLFEAFAAVVIGGVSLKGGEGRLTGVFAGVLLLSSIDTAINVMAMPAYTMQVVRGGLVLAAILLDSMKHAVHKRFL